MWVCSAAVVRLERLVHGVPALAAPPFPSFAALLAAPAGSPLLQRRVQLHHPEAGGLSPAQWPSSSAAAGVGSLGLSSPSRTSVTLAAVSQGVRQRQQQYLRGVD